MSIIENPLNKPIDKESTSDTGTDALKLGYQTVDVSKKAAQTAYKGTKIAANTAVNVGKYIAEPHTRLQSIQCEIKDIANMSEQLHRANTEIIDISERIAEKKENLALLSSIEDKTAQNMESIKKLQKDIKYLDSRREKLEKESQKISDSVSQRKDRLDALMEKLKPHPVKKTFKAALTVSKDALKVSFRASKNIAARANPFNKSIDTNSTTDTGYDALKFANKTVKTTKSVAKTSVRTARATAKAPKKAVQTVKIIYRTPIKAAKGAARVIRIATTAAAHVVAIVLNPIFWIAAIFILLVITILYPLVIILGGGAAGGTNTNIAYGTAAGTNKENTEIFNEAKEYYRIACENRQNDFNADIDSLYYSDSDRVHSDLVSMISLPEGGGYAKDFARDNRKQGIKEKFSNSIDKATAISLLYVKLEKEKNDENKSEGQIYDVVFDQDAFDDLLTSFVTWTDTTTGNQTCPFQDCTVHREEKHNPDFDTAKYNCDMSCNAFYEWRDTIQPLIEHNHHDIRDGAAQSRDWEANIGWRIDNWNSVYAWLTGYAYTSNDGKDCLADLDRISDYYVEVLNSTPETIVTETKACDHIHTLHDITLTALDKDAIMDSWGFNDLYKEWVDLTIEGFMQNPDILDEDKGG
ncbi:MAG: hypothetical protein IKW90_15835 [Lachnospiraceae bacterium]|nr:hypothetical protein [Lachnospiraceae bacterium]